MPVPLSLSAPESTQDRVQLVHVDTPPADHRDTSPSRPPSPPANIPPRPCQETPPVAAVTPLPGFDSPTPAQNPVSELDSQLPPSSSSDHPISSLSLSVPPIAIPARVLQYSTSSTSSPVQPLSTPLSAHSQSVPAATNPPPTPTSPTDPSPQGDKDTEGSSVPLSPEGMRSIDPLQLKVKKQCSMTSVLILIPTVCALEFWRGS